MQNNFNNIFTNEAETPPFLPSLFLSEFLNQDFTPSASGRAPSLQFLSTKTLTLTTQNDATISGANLNAQNIALNIGDKLSIESKQTEEDFSSSGFGFNFGVGASASGGGSISAGFNMSNSDMHRLWTDDITTIKATNAMVINTGTAAENNKGDLNLTGAAILSDNLTLNIKGK